MTRDPASLLDRRLFEAKAALAFERVWSRSFALLMTAGCLALAVLTGVLGVLPWWARLVALVAAAVGAFVWSLKPILRLRWPLTGAKRCGISRSIPSFATARSPP